MKKIAFKCFYLFIVAGFLVGIVFYLKHNNEPNGKVVAVSDNGEFKIIEMFGDISEKRYYLIKKEDKVLCIVKRKYYRVYLDDDRFLYSFDEMSQETRFMLGYLYMERSRAVEPQPKPFDDINGDGYPDIIFSEEIATNDPRAVIRIISIVDNDKVKEDDIHFGGEISYWADFNKDGVLEFVNTDQEDDWIITPEGMPVSPYVWVYDKNEKGGQYVKSRSEEHLFYSKVLSYDFNNDGNFEEVRMVYYDNGYDNSYLTVRLNVNGHYLYGEKVKWNEWQKCGVDIIEVDKSRVNIFFFYTIEKYLGFYNTVRNIGLDIYEYSNNKLVKVKRIVGDEVIINDIDGDGLKEIMVVGMTTVDENGCEEISDKCKVYKYDNGWKLCNLKLEVI